MSEQLLNESCVANGHYGVGHPKKYFGASDNPTEKALPSTITRVAGRAEDEDDTI